MNKKIIVLIILIVIVGAILGYVYYWDNTRESFIESEKQETPLTKEEVLQSLTAPDDLLPQGEPDKEVLDSLTPPEDAVPSELTPEEEQNILDSLTP